MTEEKKSKWYTFLLGSPVIGALITSMVAVALALGPQLGNNNDDTTSEPTGIVITFTPQPTVAGVAAAQPTDEPQPTAEPSATDAPAEPTITPLSIMPTATTELDPSAPVTAQLIYDGTSFTLYNATDSALNLENVAFIGGSVRWDATQWGTGLVRSLPAGSCLRLRDVNSGQQQPPSICRSLHGLQLIGDGFIFWRGVDAFDVTQNSQTITTCNVSDGRCDVATR